MGHRTDGPPQNHHSFSFPEKPYARQLKRGALALRDFFVMPLTLPIPIFEKISLRGALEKSVKLWVLHKNDFLCNTRFLSNFSRAPCRDIFSKIGMGNVRGITKNVPNLQVYEHTPATPTTLSIKVVIVVLY